MSLQNRTIRDFLSYIRAVRAPYLSTAPPPRRYRQNQNEPVTTNGAVPEYITDTQREAIDTQTSILLRDLDKSVTALKDACEYRHQKVQEIHTKKYGKSTNFLLKWAAGTQNAQDAGKSDEQLREEGREDTIYKFRDGVLWYLSFGLSQAVRLRQEMVEKRLEREREKQSSMLYNESNRYVKVQQTEEDEDVFGLAKLNVDMRGRDTYNPALDSHASQEQELSPEQLQLFEEENNSLMNHYNETLTKVTQVEKSLLDISSLQQTLIGHLNVQGEMIGGLVEDAARTDENVTRGNKELKRATERTSTARLMYYITFWMCLFLIVWDLIF